MKTNKGIYKITNKNNDKIYIGSSVNTSKRWHNHLHALRRGVHTNPRLQSAYRKHGEDSFVFSVVETVDGDDILEREQYWLDETGAINNGYNICSEAGRAYPDYWNDLTDDERFALGEHKAQTFKQYHQSMGREMNDEGGAGDRWLRENDPNYGTKDADYLTPRQYKHRSSEREVLINPQVISETLHATSPGPTIVSGDMDWMKRKPRHGDKTPDE